MNIKFLAGSALTALLVAGAPFVALAHDDTQANVGLNLGSFISTHVGIGTHADVDTDADNDHATTSTPRANVAAGTVTAVNGSTFTIAGLFGKATTTVVTDANTVYKAKGGATSSVAINVGSRVFVVGTTTATSTSGNTVAASLVVILGNFFGHLHSWFSFHAK